MEEKKLTDEEIVKALECCIKGVTVSNCAECPLDMIEEDCCYYTPTLIDRYALDLIHRLQKENEELKSPKFASWKLKFFNLKEEFDKELAEHEEFTKKANAEIERLTKWKDKLQDTKDELEQQLIDTGFKEYCEENAELRKQVDELKEERENMQAVIFGLEEDKRLLQKQVDELKTENTELYKEHTTVIAGSILQKKQAVRDTAKEIWNELYKKHTEVYNQYVFKKDSDYDDLETNAIINFSDSLYFEITKYFKEKYGVEVE